MATEGPRLTSTLDLMRWVGWAQMKAFDAWMRERDISPEQGFVLRYLSDNPGTIQREIAEVTRTTPASVTSLLQGLERRELVTRTPDPANARSKLVFITDHGAELIAGLDEATGKIEEDLLAPLDGTERAQLHELFVKLTAPLPDPIRE